MSNDDRVGRRSFLRGGSGLALGLLGGALAQAEEIKPKPKAKAPAKAAEKPPAPVTCAVIGLGDQGRDTIKALATLPGANVKLLCDPYTAIHQRAVGLAAGSAAVEDYRKILDDKTIKAVWIATPTHLHKDLALAALQAGKHVYCEAPLAHTVEDAHAIAAAAKKHPKQVFQAGCQRRTNPLEQHVFGFMRAGVLAKTAMGRGHWNKKASWRRAAATNEREKVLNWRLDGKVSAGLAGEVALHQIDVASWFLRATPVSVTGMGTIAAWKDGRDVADTIQLVFEYPNGVNYLYTATLASSFEADRDVFQGSEATILMHKDRAWMLKESDAPNLGWEVYATKEAIHDDTGIALVANATKLLDAGLDPSENRDAYTKGPLYYSCEAFLNAVRGVAKTPCGPAEGLEATIVALKANEAVVKGTKITFDKTWFTT
jgi:predicted dehydrogenase